MSICVAYGNKVLDTRLPQLAGCGDKYDVSGLGSGLLRCTRNDGTSNGDELHRPWCHKILGTDCASRPSITGGRAASFVRLLRCYTPRNDVFNNTPHSALSRHSLPQGARECGRSMIEMLGVLAIIAVLSVGGIAGYSKAMEKFKIDKLVNDYSHMVLGLLEYRQNLQEYSKGTYFLSDVLISLNLVPNTWKQISTQYMQDDLGNFVGPYYREKTNYWNDDSPEQSGIVVDFIFGGLKTNDDGQQIAANFNEKVCYEVLEKIVYPLHYAIKATILAGGSGYYYGREFCNSSRQCINTMTLSQMKSMCASCDKTRRCGLTIIL